MRLKKDGQKDLLWAQLSSKSVAIHLILEVYEENIEVNTVEEKNLMKMSMPTSELDLTFTVWKFQNFSATQIFREISLWQIQR